MSGHSKWANIKFRKAAQDSRKGAVYSKLSKAILLATRRGGKDPETNFDLKNALMKAREFGLPKDNIQRAIARGAGEVEGITMEELTYEGYGPGGAGIIVEAASENRNRTASDVRHLFTKFGGSLGTIGSVSWKFKRMGLIVVPKDIGDKSVTEMEALEAGADLGAEDVKPISDGYEILTSIEDFGRVRLGLEKRGLAPRLAELSLLPSVQIPIVGDDAKRTLELVMELESLEDVQNVTTDADIPDELFSQAA
ncbi:YebC/PmpR family DNA-binding transcriptional regulator [bacterium]|nr:YebC/PmpR family DNA-binding transcriptional regulator [bacterium]